MSREPLTAIVVGAGHRAQLYASYAQAHPEELRIVGVADPSDLRRELMQQTYGFDAVHCWESAGELAQLEQQADVIINGTMDDQHVPTTVPLLKRGYDVLLEKPFATGEEEMWDLVETAEAHDSRVVICHVLRYAPFYAAVRQHVAAGEIGELLNVQTTEHVSYHHMAVAFVRGKWARRDCGSPMLMAKCCHDLDLMVWMKSGIAPTYVSSFGALSYFRAEKAPQGAGERCLVDCPIEADCPYSARKHYLDHPERWAFYVWAGLEGIENPTDADRLAHLRTSPFGRCVWHTDNDVVDHQSVMVEFSDGATATHNMIGGASRPSRSIHLLGTEGEIQGCFEEQSFVIRHPDPRPGHEYSERKVDLSVGGDMHGAFGGHGGGDMRLVGDFLRVVRGEEPSLSTTTLTDSVAGHLVGFRADVAMRERRVVSLERGNDRV